jgi:hypothetical protein
MTDGGHRLTIREMRRLDWALLCDALPDEDTCDELQGELKRLCWGEGWLRKDGSPSRETTRYVQGAWKGLAGGSYAVGEFRVERVGRWGVQFAIDARYAAERTPPRRQRGDRTAWEDGWEVGNHGNRSDLLPFKIGSADAAAWYSGYLAGRARRANTARGRRLERAELCVRSQNTSDQK